MTLRTQRLRARTTPAKSVAALALLAGLTLGLLAFAPARWLAAAFEGASQGRLRLPNAQGTVWQGKADLVLSGGPDSAAAQGLPQGIQWQLEPNWTRQGPGLRLSLQAPCCTPQSMVWRASWANNGLALTLAQHSSHWPAEWLAGLGAPWNTLWLEGQLKLETPELVLNLRADQLAWRGQLTIQAEDVSTRLSTLRPLGSYRLLLLGDGSGPPSLQLSTLRGDLRLNGDGQWINHQLRFRGTADAPPDNVDALSNLLNILGRREGTRAHISLG